MEDTKAMSNFSEKWHRISNEIIQSVLPKLNHAQAAALDQQFEKLRAFAEDMLPKLESRAVSVREALKAALSLAEGLIGGPSFGPDGRMNAESDISYRAREIADALKKLISAHDLPSREDLSRVRSLAHSLVTVMPQRAATHNVVQSAHVLLGHVDRAIQAAESTVQRSEVSEPRGLGRAERIEAARGALRSLRAAVASDGDMVNHLDDAIAALAANDMSKAGIKANIEPRILMRDGHPGNATLIAQVRRVVAMIQALDVGVDFRRDESRFVSRMGLGR
jgi:hypothetical protein